MPFFRPFALLLLALPALWAQEPLVLKTVQPDYGPDAGKPGFTEPVRVDVLCFPNGEPLSFQAETSLPDAVVDALAQYRFQKRSDFFAVSLTLTVFRPFGSPHGWLAGASTGGYAARNAAKKLSAQKAAKLEDKLKSGRDSLQDRATLLAYAALNPGADTSEMRARQLAWLIREDPGAGELASPHAFINVEEGPAADPLGYAQTRQAWNDALRTHSGEWQTVGNATYFLRLSAPEEVESLLIPRLKAMHLAASRLGETYALAALGVTALSPETGRAVAALPELPQSAFALHAREALLKEHDIRVSMAALATLRAAGDSLTAAGRLPEGFQALCESLQQHARDLYPPDQGTCVPKPAAAGITTEVIAARIKRQPRPKYPEEAKRRGIQGRVLFTGTIGKDGKIRSLEVQEGPFLLLEPSRRVVSRWEYEPTSIDGEPVDVVTDLEVKYDLN